MTTKRKDPERLKRSRSIALSDAEYAKLKAEARKYDLTPSKYISKLIAKLP
jgi:hypothetical protein